VAGEGYADSGLVFADRVAARCEGTGCTSTFGSRCFGLPAHWGGGGEVPAVLVLNPDRKGIPGLPSKADADVTTTRVTVLLMTDDVLLVTVSNSGRAILISRDAVDAIILERLPRTATRRPKSFTKWF
jgi:hypothetical protein